MTDRITMPPGGIPSSMEIACMWVRFHRDTVATSVRVRGRVQGLMGIAN